MTTQELEREYDAATNRSLFILTEWLRKHTKWSYTTRFAAGKFELIMRDGHSVVRGWFKGESVQDAYAQAAQTIQLNDGET